jgi:sugar fermentation stimulation protein A
MLFKPALHRGRLIRRYKRFFADVALDQGETVTAHCPNPGSMLGLAEPGAEAFLSVSDNPKRRLRHTLEIVRQSGALVGVNTSLANRLAAEALEREQIPALAGYSSVRREVPCGDHSRIDFLLDRGTGPSSYVEVKSVTLSRTPGLAEFPDSVTLRGARHLATLARLASAGQRSVMLFVVQREDCTRLSLAADLDPRYAEAFAAAHASGVEALCHACRVSPRGIALGPPLPIVPA